MSTSRKSEPLDRGDLGEIKDDQSLPDSGRHEEEEDFQHREDAGHRRVMERRNQELGWVGRLLGGSEDSPAAAREIIVVSVIVVATSVLHWLQPDHSVLMPVITAALGFIAGRNSK